MRHRNMLWTGHLFVLVFLGDGVRWLVRHIRGLPEFSLLLVLASMTVLVLNHIRWWTLGKEIKDDAMLKKTDGLILSNYCLLVLVLALIDFGR